MVAIWPARTNARTLRPLISTEMWMQMNVFHRDVMAITPDQLTGDHLTRLCARLKEGVQAHTGITEGTFFRDQGWNFYMLGRLIERADVVGRQLDGVTAGGAELVDVLVAGGEGAVGDVDLLGV